VAAEFLRDEQAATGLPKFPEADKNLSPVRGAGPRCSNRAPDPPRSQSAARTCEHGFSRRQAAVNLASSRTSGASHRPLQFLSDWLARDPLAWASSLEQFAYKPAYGLQDLHADLERFVFLLDGSDGAPCSARCRSSCNSGI
jgi:hypothetical protein